MRHDQTHRHEDRGAALILAIGFVVMVGSIAGGLTSLASSSLNNRGSLEQLRDRQYAADGAIDEAIVQVRVSASSAAAATEGCQASSGTTRTSGVNILNGFPMRVDWKSACTVARSSDGDVAGPVAVVVQRNAIFAACVDKGVACTDATVVIRAQVNFEQASSGAVTKTYVQSWSVNQ